MGKHDDRRRESPFDSPFFNFKILACGLNLNFKRKHNKDHRRRESAIDSLVHNMVSSFMGQPGEVQGLKYTRLHSEVMIQIMSFLFSLHHFLIE